MEISSYRDFNNIPLGKQCVRFLIEVLVFILSKMKTIKSIFLNIFFKVLQKKLIRLRS